MSITVRKLNDAGVSEFRAYLGRLSANPSEALPRSLLTDPLYSVALASTASVDSSLAFPDKVEFGKYLASALGTIPESHRMDTDVGLWSWLGLCFFEQICPAGRDGSRKPGAEHRYILSRGYKRVYRHLVRTPCVVYAVHGENSRVLLSGTPDKHGEASEAVLSREHLFTNRPLFEAIGRLYLNVMEGQPTRLKRGARGAGGGSLRRLGKVVRQFDLTYDLRAMSPDRIVGLLPTEFERYRH